MPSYGVGVGGKKAEGQPTLAPSLAPPGRLPRLPGVCRLSQALRVCPHPHLTTLRNTGYFL